MFVFHLQFVHDVLWLILHLSYICYDVLMIKNDTPTSETLIWAWLCQSNLLVFDLIKKLNKDFHKRTIEAKANLQLTPYSGVIRRDLTVKRATSFGTSTIGTYNLNGKNRGVLFVVNNIDFPNPDRRRTGAERDTERLLDLFNQMEFTIFNYINLRKSEFVSLMQQLSSSKHLRSADCLFFVVLTHGNR